MHAGRDDGTFFDMKFFHVDIPTFLEALQLYKTVETLPRGGGDTNCITVQRYLDNSIMLLAVFTFDTAFLLC